ncbi:MAG: hypothetical protein K8T90_17730 [Planctomycetes bacterium]|nr:hypothetical protein [Planctomycetota bacterium]
MSKLVLFLTIPAAAGLVVWNLSLSSEIQDLRQQIASTDAAGPAPAKSAGDAKTSADAARPQPTPRANPQVAELATRLAEIERRLPAAPGEGPTAGQATASAESGPAVSASASDIIAAYSTDTFKGAVAKVLDERDEARRKERMERQADGIARNYLRDLTVTDQQRADVKKAVLAGMVKVEAIRDDETISDEQRRTDIQALQQERLESLAAVLDAQQMEVVRQRATQTRGPGPQNGGNGGGGRRRPGGGGN